MNTIEATNIPPEDRIYEALAGKLGFDINEDASDVRAIFVTPNIKKGVSGYRVECVIRRKHMSSMTNPEFDFFVDDVRVNTHEYLRSAGIDIGNNRVSISVRALQSLDQFHTSIADLQRRIHALVAEIVPESKASNTVTVSPHGVLAHAAKLIGINLGGIERYSLQIGRKRLLPLISPGTQVDTGLDDGGSAISEEQSTALKRGIDELIAKLKGGKHLAALMVKHIDV